jgi:hypothetical protein
VVFRVLDDGKVIDPGPEFVVPANQRQTFLFAGSGPRRACGHLLRIQWRSPTGRSVMLNAGTLTVKYNQAPHDTGACA